MSARHDLAPADLAELVRAPVTEVRQKVLRALDESDTVAAAVCALHRKADAWADQRTPWAQDWTEQFREGARLLGRMEPRAKGRAR